MEINKVYLGNNLDVLKTFPDNSIDSVVTDPPYGLGKEPNANEVLQSWITKGYHEIKGKGFMGKEWDAFVPQPNFWKEIYRVLKPGGYVLSFAGTRTYDWMVMAVRLAGFEIRDMIAWLYGSGFPKSRNVGKDIEKINVGGIKNLKKIGLKKGIKGESGTQGFSYSKEYVPGVSMGGKQIQGEIPIYEINNEWQGWGTALKPALEPIVMARKPLDGTVAQNVLKYGVGGINIDECKIIPNMTPGRFPANVIHDGSDEVVSLFPYTESGKMTNEHQRHTDGSPNGIYGKFDKEHPLSETYGDSGSAARFFYTAKASKEERNFGLYDFEKDVVTDGKTKPIDNAFNRGETKRKNIHPTVKPIDLMRYLVRLVTPKNGICLDPYLGSGTTAIACEMEKFSWIGIELVPEYAEIAKARIGAVKDYEATLDTKTFIKESIKEDKEKELGIQNIFDFIEE